MSSNSPLANKPAVSTNMLEDYIEVLHGDNSMPNVSAALQKKSNRMKSHRRHIYVYERGSQFDILRSMPNTFMYVSPMPENLLKRYGLVQKRCSDSVQTNKDVLIYQSSYRLSRNDQLFLDELNNVIKSI
jgi:hypothetical protein